MNIFRPQKPYVFCPPKYSPWFRPVLHFLCAFFLRHKFNIRRITVRGEEHLVRFVRDGQSVLVTPNHADHADPSLLIHVGRQNGFTFHFMAAREGFEQSWLRRFVLQRSGAFSVDREGADLASIRTAMNILRECRHPLVIFPEGEIYHHHEELDFLNDGVATILLRAAEKLPEGKRSYAAPVAIHVTHDPSVAATFPPRMDALERRITWKPKSKMEIVDRIYGLGSALISIKEEEFMGRAQQGGLVERIQSLQQYLIEQAERKHGLTPGRDAMPIRFKAVRHVIRQKLNASAPPPSRDQQADLYDDLDRVYAAQQLYSYPGQYLRQQPTVDRIAETLHKLEEDVLELERYPAPRNAEIAFGEPIDVRRFLEERRLNAKTGVRSMTELVHQRIRELMKRAPGGSCTGITPA
jgi:1-acyl-sn-glycerol-3-phosphate acyltransferase